MLSRRNCETRCESCRQKCMIFSVKATFLVCARGRRARLALCVTSACRLCSRVPQLPTSMRHWRLGNEEDQEHAVRVYRGCLFDARWRKRRSESRSNALGRFPLHALEGISLFSYAGASPALMGACCERGIRLTFFSPSGRYLVDARGVCTGNVLLKKAQFRASEMSVFRFRGS